MCLKQHLGTYEANFNGNWQKVSPLCTEHNLYKGRALALYGHLGKAKKMCDCASSMLEKLRGHETKVWMATVLKSTMIVMDFIPPF